MRHNQLFKWMILASLCLFLFIGSPLHAQTQDTFKIKNKTRIKDTLDIYKRIQKSANKYKFTRFIYSTIFIDPAPLKYDKKPLSDAQIVKDPNLVFEGKIIRKITITILDPFGYSANDTSQESINSLQKLGNSVHILSQKRVVQNRLLFKSYDKVFLAKIRESERLLRTANFINDAKIYINASLPLSDSVDIKIRVQDKWTIDPSISIGTTSASIRLRDKNLLGMGHTFDQKFKYDLNSGSQYNNNYIISNIRNTFISANANYFTKKYNQNLGIQFDRPFYSIFTKYAGGASVNKTWGTFLYTDSLEKHTKLNYINMDFWFARGFTIPVSKHNIRTGVRLIAAIRYANLQFQQRPTFNIDTNKSNAHNALYLGSFGLSFRKYYKDQYIYRFGANEDVPEGLLVQALYGYYQKEFTGIWKYRGLEISQGKHIPHFGYISANVNYGTLFQNAKNKNSTLTAGIYYFSNLSLENKWYIRQFVNLKYIQGFNKSPLERITLRSDEMFGFRSGILVGTTKMLLNLSTVMYAPYNLIGFKFAPVVLIGLGMLETRPKSIFTSKIYQSYALGLLIRNESLLNSSFEITGGMYPNLPDQSHAVYKLNPVVSFTLRVMSFAISKPNMVVFE